MVDRWLLVVSNLVVDNTQVDMSQKLSSDICYFFVLHVVSDGFIVMRWVQFTKLHVVDSNAVVGQCFSVNIADSSTNLKEFLVLSNRFFELSQVVVENSSAVVGSAFISAFTSPFACEGQDFIVFEALLSCDAIVRVRVAHCKAWVVIHDVLLKALIFLNQSLFWDDVFFTLRGVEVNRQLDALCLIDSQRQIAFFLQVTKSEALEVLFSKCLSI